MLHWCFCIRSTGEQGVGNLEWFVYIELCQSHAIQVYTLWLTVSPCSHPGRHTDLSHSVKAHPLWPVGKYQNTLMKDILYLKCHVCSCTRSAEICYLPQIRCTFGPHVHKGLYTARGTCLQTSVARLHFFVFCHAMASGEWWLITTVSHSLCRLW